MKKTDCWLVLGIKPTNDSSIIKQAYRDLIKRHHPDRAKSPEGVRKNTIKSVEIIQAYKEAVALADNGQAEVVRPGTREKSSPGAKHVNSVQQEQGVFSRIFGLVFILTLMGFVVTFFLEMFGIGHGITYTMKFIFRTYKDTPDNNLFKQIISLPLSVILGCLFNMVLSIFTVTPVYYLWGVFYNTKYEKYMYKLGMLIVMVINFYLVYFSSLHMPYEHASSGYYEFLHQIAQFFAWACGPIYLFIEWISEYMQYNKVKTIYDSNLVLKP